MIVTQVLTLEMRGCHLHIHVGGAGVAVDGVVDGVVDDDDKDEAGMLQCRQLDAWLGQCALGAPRCGQIAFETDCGKCVKINKLINK